MPFHAMIFVGRSQIEAGSEQYAPLARAIIGGLTSSVLLTIFIVPAAYVLVYRRRNRNA